MSVPLAAGAAAVSAGVGLAGFPTTALAAAATPSERISVLDFIPVGLRAGVLDGTGTADLTAYIQAAIDTRPGVFLDVQFPTGVYRVDGTLRVLRSHIWLSGENATLLHGGAGDAIQFGDGINRWDRIQIGGFLMGKAQAASAGAMIRSRLCSTVIVRDCYFYGDNKIFDVMSFERGYMVGHTGDLQAAIQAAQAVDKAIGAIAAAVQDVHGALLITADHGNLEMMRDASTGQPHTAHTVGPVPLVYIGPRKASLRAGGALRDVAPTILDLLGLPQPEEMTGRSLLEG